MEYTVQKLARLAGISPRALRHYDAIGLLIPRRMSSSGYRIYGPAEVDRLQQILFYRELGVSLDEIQQIVTASGFDQAAALRQHHERLLDRKAQIEHLIANVEKSIALAERGVQMTDQEKFAGFKKEMIEENEQKYGQEVRAKYGSEAMDRSNQKMLNLTPDQYAALEKLSQDVNETLRAAFQQGDPGSGQAQLACSLHKQWLLFFWDNYSPEAHMALTQGYVDDERFTAYYDRIAPGCAVFLRDAMRIYTGIRD